VTGEWLAALAALAAEVYVYAPDFASGPARAYALAAGAAKDPTTKARYADRAITLAVEAIHFGWKGLAQFPDDPDFAAVRERLVRELEQDTKPAPSLKVGDPAPALKADAWLQGPEVEAFVPGRVYVVDFWAARPGPCATMTPLLEDVQAAYRDKDVTFIAFSTTDPMNSRARVAAWVAQRGPKLGCRFAHAEKRTTQDAWMKAAGRAEFPTCFIVDRAGKIAFAGPPIFLNVVLPRVLAGTWKAEEGAAELEKLEREAAIVRLLLRQGDAETGLKALADLEAARQELIGLPYYVGPKLGLLLRGKKFEEAGKVADATTAQAIARADAETLRVLSTVLRSTATGGRKDMLERGGSARPRLA